MSYRVTDSKAGGNEFMQGSVRNNLEPARRRHGEVKEDESEGSGVTRVRKRARLQVVR